MKQFLRENKNSIILYSLVAIIAIAAYFLFLKFDSFAGILKFLLSILTPFVIGFIISYLLNPLMKLIETKWLSFLRSKKNTQSFHGMKRIISIIITYILTISALTALVFLLTPQITASVEMLFKNIPEYIRVLSGNISDFVNNNHLNSEWVEQMLPYDTLTDYATNLFQACFGWIMSAPKYITTGFTNILVGIIISIYFLYDKERFQYAILKTIYALSKKETAERIEKLSTITHKTFSRFILGKIIDSLIIGLIAFPFMLIIYRPYALLISVIIGITNVIPFFGPFIGAIPSAILIFIVVPERTVWFIVFVFLLQQFDGNILGPKILGETTGMSPILVLLGIFAGSKLLGFVGMIVGVPLTAVVYLLLKAYIDKKYQEKFTNESQISKAD